MTVSDFFYFEPVELLSLFRTEKERIEAQHRLNYIAVRNAIGSCFNKNYKYVDVFDDKGDIPKEYTEEEAQSLKDDLRRMANALSR